MLYEPFELYHLGRIPSVIIKLFRSFIDLAPSYYDQTQQVEDMVSIKDVGNTMADILKQCVRNASVLHRLITEDTFFMMIRIMTAKPIDSVAQDSEPAYLIWKSKTVDILKSVDMNGEVCQYLHNRRCVDLIIRLWRDCISKDYLTFVDYREIHLGLDLIYFQLERSAKIQFYSLFEEMLQGYELLCKILKLGPFSDPILDLKVKQFVFMFTVTRWKFFVGKISPIPSLSDGLPYQHADFSTPQPRGLTDKIVKNTPAYQCLLASFLYPTTPNRYEIPISLQFHIFSAMKDIIEIHPCNYFVVEHTNSVPQFIESMENYDIQIQKGIMELLIFIMVDLNFVPLKELAVLSLHLQSSSSGKMIALICKYLTELVKTSPKFYIVVQEAGLINIMSLMLSDVTEKVQAQAENDEFLQNVLESFDQIIDCIIAMTSTPTNVVMFRKSYRGNLFDLLQYPETRIGALRLFESLSSQAYDSKSPSLSESPSPGSPSSPGAEAGNAFSRVMEAIQYIPRDDLDFRLEVLKTIKRIFKAHKSTRDIFRRVGGYVSLVSMIVALEGAFEEPERFGNHDSLETVQEKLIAVIQTIFAVLAESMHDYDVNKKYFSTNVGYGSLENAITLTGALKEGFIPHQIFGVLFAFALDDESVHDLFVEPPAIDTDSQAVTLDLLKRIELVLKSSGARVVNPEITPTILNLQQLISKNDAKLSRAVLCAIYALAQASRGNQVKMNTSGLILGLLRRAFPQSEQQEPVKDAEREIILQITKKLMTMGVSYQEILYMFQQFNVQEGAVLDKSGGLMDLILQGASRSRWPNFIQFDMGSNPNACLELPQLENFPPANPGYTVLSWIHIEKLDDFSNLSLLSIWDDGNLIFKIYIDAMTKMMKVYSVSSKQDTVFNSFEFHPGFWYHLTIVHNKSRLSMKSSSMSLYINGVLMEQVSSPYITQPSVPTMPLRAVIGSLGDEHLLQKSQLVWDLGPTYLIQDTLEKETINLFFNLGARYKSLFQDSLRQFQTYEASASLFLTLKSLSKAKSSQTSRRDSVQTQVMLANVMKSTHFQSIPEHKILFAFFASNTLAEGHRTGLTLSGLSDTTLATIAMEIDHSHMVINSAIPKLDTAVYMPRNMGYLAGGPIVAYPFGLDESIWKIGGCGIALKLIERSETPETLCKATAILFEIIRYSWRNSEDMERCHGYEILAYLLKQKRDLITPELIELLLVFIGKDPHSPEESIINNPLAYRYVILNFEIWKKTAIAVQRAQLDQFILFLNTSKMRNFNSKRLPKIHLVKKILLAFRMNIYAKELVPHLIDALKAIMLSNWTTESIRAVATFLASTVSKVPSSLKAPRRLGRSDSTHSTSSVSSIDSEAPSSATTDIITDSKNHHSNTTKSVQMRNIVLEMLHDILCDKSNGPDYIGKFATTITNKWPLLFFAPNLNPFTVVLTARILARICITQGPAYVQKFRSTSEGFLVLRHLLPAYWNLTQLHETLMLMMIGIDVAEYPIYSTFDINHLRTCLHDSKEGNKMAVPDILPIIIAMWDEARKTIEVPATRLTSTPTLMRPRTRSNSVNVRPMTEKQTISPASRAQVSKTIDDFIQLFDELYDSRPVFKEACNKQDVVDCIVQVLFPSVCPTHQMTAEDELVSKDVVLTNFDLDHLNSPSSAAASPIDSPYFDRFGKLTDDDTASIDSNTATSGSSIIKRGGTSALMTKTSPHVSKRGNAFMTRLRSASWSQANATPTNTRVLQDAMLDSLLNFVVDICIESITDPQSKNLGALLLVFGAFPPSSHEQQLLFESYLLTHIAQNLKSTVQLEMELMLDPRVLANLAKFSQMAADAVIQGRFREGGTEQTYDLLATLLEILHMDEFSSRYSANDASVVAIYRAFNRMILVKISDLEHGDLDSLKTVAFLDYCIHHQKIILSAKNNDMEFMKCFCYHLYRYLLSNDDKVRDSAANMWKLLVLQRPDTVDAVFNIRIKGVELDDLIDGFKHMLEMDVESFYRWLDSRKVELNILFTEHMSKSWENTIIQENKYSKETFKNYITRRINKLKKIQKREAYEQEIMMDYTQKTQAWSQSIQEIEMGRFTKALQDFDGHENFISSEWTRIAADLIRERSIWGPRVSLDLKWRLDYTEGPNRMRKRLQYISNTDYSSYMPKQTTAHGSPKLIKSSIHNAPKSEVQIDKELTQEQSSILGKEDEPSAAEDNSSINKGEAEEEEEEEQQISYEEDKNRKVLRLLDQGDMVLDVYNVSQIAGLDACEGLLLLCKNNIYLIDNFFQLADGEVVEIWDVPKEERDQYLLLVAQAAGMETEPFISSSGDLHTCRKWATADLRDVFKRRFLFRDVALEIFFTDGQNALITVALSERDELYSKLVSRVAVHEESGGTIFGREKDSYTTTGLSSTFRLSSLFGTSTLHDLTQRWERKEITNFQYLMYLNAIAGRSYNDLTQYPVFPWILADYHSEELDLNDPKSFRDLTRPMGAQTAERRQEFAERYRQWGETDDPTPAFHYGTHYSSAMIVCSFLIRLEPFTQHYLKLQGGTFDHADRLFDSIGKAWESASEKNMGDVRELIPEFFYLPEFLTNVNKFNFGVKQGTGEAIDSIVLPPWAHGDPKIFIQRHREALESEYVSAHLHHWIDLIFGFKQQGQHAIDALNVFHHVSYEGAVDLDSITDIVEKTATIGIINNFGQTPRQLFRKPHPARSPTVADPMVLGHYIFQEHLNKLVQSLMPLRDIKQQIESIDLYNEKLGVTSCQQLLMPPDGLRYIEWGFSDNSLRLFSTETGKQLNVFENMHVGFISAACFPDSRTLVTGGTDNLVCIWQVKNEKTATDFALVECLKGHSSVVTTIAASRTYSILVTGSEDKTAIVWDLNRKQYVKTLDGHENGVQIIRINDTTGDIITCSGHIIRVWTVNGDLYLTKSACPSSESILSCIYYERKLTEWSSKDLIITGHRRGVVKFWLKHVEIDAKTGQHKWSLALVHELRHKSRVDGNLDTSDIVALSMSSSRKTLFTGSKQGQVYGFVLPDTSDTYHVQREDKCRECMTCKRAFSVLGMLN
ncbi:hypothetical protein PS6_005689 [Mucor atramentarius]